MDSNLVAMAYWFVWKPIQFDVLNTTLLGKQGTFR